MAYSPIVWVYRDPLTIQKLQQGEDNNVWTSEHRIIGCNVDVTGSDTANIAGGRVEIAGKWLKRDTNDGTTGLSLTAAEASSWFSASGGEGSATGWYIVAFNDSGSSFICKYRLSAPAYSDTSSGTGIGEKIYDKTGTTWMRYIGFVSNDDTNNYIKQSTYGDWVTYLQVLTAASTTGNCFIAAGAATTATTASVSRLVPSWSRQCNITITTLGAGHHTYVFGGDEPIIEDPRQFFQSTSPVGGGYINFVRVSPLREVAYKVSANTSNIHIDGYSNAAIRGHA